MDFRCAQKLVKRRVIIFEQKYVVKLPVFQPVCHVRRVVPRIRCGSTSLVIPRPRSKDLIAVHRNTKMTEEDNRVKVYRTIIRLVSSLFCQSFRRTWLNIGLVFTPALLRGKPNSRIWNISGFFGDLLPPFHLNLWSLGVLLFNQGTLIEANLLIPRYTNSNTL